MFELKALHQDAIPKALERVERYRLLNEPEAAESICRDVLVLDPDHQQALVRLILSLTDQFGDSMGSNFNDARDAASRLTSSYDKEYYSGIICERRAKAHYARLTPTRGSVAYHWLCDAMEHYEDAEQHSPEGDDDAILRWNTCARMIMANSDIEPEELETSSIELE